MYKITEEYDILAIQLKVNKKITVMRISKAIKVYRKFRRGRNKIQSISS